MSGEFSLETIVVYQYDHTCLDVLLRTLSKFVASRKLTILGFGRTDAPKEGEKGRKGGGGQKTREMPWWKKNWAREKEGERRANEREEEGPDTTRKKADTADVAGERNAAGTSGRKLRGRVRRWGSGARGNHQRAVQRERGTKVGFGQETGARGCASGI